MKIFVVVLILINFFSSVYANTIFYLTKIPNLEIYDLSSSNNIKYLTAEKAFRVGFRENNVQCDNADKNNIKKKFDLIKKNFDKYDKNFLKKINLKYVVLCENLKVAEIKTAGVPNHKVKTLIMDINFDKRYFERSIHHEIFHMIDNSYPELFKKNKWRELNNKDFSYAACSTCADLLGLNLEIINGFLTEYSMSTAEEDMAEIYSLLKTNYKETSQLIKKDKILIKKKNFLVNSLQQIDEQFIF